VTYIHRHYISRLLHRLTEEYSLYSSVIELRSSVITEKRILISCSGMTSQAKLIGVGLPIITMTTRQLMVLKGMPIPLNTNGELYNKSV
jgi:hypothetical protein